MEEEGKKVKDGEVERLRKRKEWRYEEEDEKNVEI